MTKLTFGASNIQSQALTQVGPGQWHSVVRFSTAGLAMNGTVQVVLNASTGIGPSVSLPIPFSIASQ